MVSLAGWPASLLPSSSLLLALTCISPEFVPKRTTRTTQNKQTTSTNKQQHTKQPTKSTHSRQADRTAAEERLAQRMGEMEAAHAAALDAALRDRALAEGTLRRLHEEEVAALKR